MATYSHLIRFKTADVVGSSRLCFQFATGRVVRTEESKTNLFGLRARKAATISGKAEVRLLPVLDCKKMSSSSRKMRQRKPSHFGSYIQSGPTGKLFTARAFIGVIGGLRNLSIELLDVTTGNGILLYLVLTSILPCQRHRFQVLLSSSKLINFT